MCFILLGSFRRYNTLLAAVHSKHLLRRRYRTSPLPPLTRLRKAAVGAEDEQLDVLVHQLLERGVGVRAVDDRALVLLVVASLRVPTSSTRGVRAWVRQEMLDGVVLKSGRYYKFITATIAVVPSRRDLICPTTLLLSSPLITAAP